MTLVCFMIILYFFLGNIVMECEHVSDNTQTIETKHEKSTTATSKRANTSDVRDHYEKSEDGKRATCINCLNSKEK